jgi:hypothetical protein
MSVSLVCSVLTVAAFGAEAPMPDALPAPRVFVEPAPVPVYYRRSHYAVWQAYSPNRAGAWVPRIDYVPGDGYYYVRDGKPADWAQLYPQWYRPYVQGTPYRLPPPVVYYLLPEPPAKPEPDKKED